MQHYGRLLAMTVLSFISMYVLMYAMVNTRGDVFNNINQVYMAGLMTAPMVLIELVLMGSMYSDRRRNAAIVAAAVVLGIACFIFIRLQFAVTDQQFLRSMIPHHSSAILMCREAPVQRAEIRDLCRTIIASQQREIDQMKGMLGH